MSAYGQKYWDFPPIAVILVVTKMTRTLTKTEIRFFAALSLAFWLGVVVLSALWKPVWDYMKSFMQMHAEYSLLEQGSKLLLLVMLFTSLLELSNRKDEQAVRLGVTFSLFAVALYAAESNFIWSELQPLFGAFFILTICWRLLRSDWLALLFMLLGGGFIFLGIVSDVALDKPALLPATPFFEQWKANAAAVEEQFDLWGIACMSFASLVAFRATLMKVFSDHPGDLLVLLVSLSLIAAGNGFVHWQYNPSPIFQVLSSALAMAGIFGLSRIDRRISGRGFELTRFDRERFYVGLIIAFVVLPVVFGGTGLPFNLIFWLSFFYYFQKLLLRSHPSIPGAA
jgi:hypothetical protein